MVMLMKTEARVINVAPDSDLGRLLKDVGVSPVILEKEGELFTLVRNETKDIWATYEPEKVLEALRHTKAILAGVDEESLLSDIRADREQDSNGRPCR